MIELPGRIKTSSFSWSLRRQYYFRFCLRAYIFYYHLSHGGNYPYAAAENRLLYRLKYLSRAEAWLQKLFFQTIHNTFFETTTPVPISQMAQLLRQRGMKSFYREYQMIKKGDWQKDAKLPNIAEVYYREEALGPHTCENWARQLQHYLDRFIANPVFGKLSGMNSLCWRRFNSPASVYLGELKLWFSPILSWREPDCAHLLLPETTQQEAENRRLKIAVASLFLSRISGLPPEQQQIYLLSPDSGDIIMRRPKRDRINLACSEIAASSAEMRYFEEKMAGQNRLPAGDADGCQQCNFREFCYALSE